jgi:glutamate carboxypeptidase
MPFSVDSGTVRGPGVFDMKGGLTQMVFALQAIKELGLKPEVAPIILINSDEEIGSRESGPFIRELAQRANRVFVLEPALGLSGKLKTARKGVGRFELTVNGRAAHAGLDPEKGISAILELSHTIQKLFAMNDPEKGISVNVGRVEGGLRPNVVAPECKAQIDVRVPSKEDARRIEGEIFSLETVTPGTSLEINGRFNRAPLEKTPANRRLWTLAQELSVFLDLELSEGMAGGGSDGNTTSQYTATLDGLGAVGDGAHAQHEFLYIDRMAERSALLASLVMAPPI